MPDLHSRLESARRLLRGVHARLSASHPARAAPAAGLDAVDEVFREIDGLLPGLAEPPRAVLARVIYDLTRRERALLKRAIESEREARRRLLRLLGAVPAAHAEDALARVEAQESINAELSALFGLFGQSLAGSRFACACAVKAAEG